MDTQLTYSGKPLFIDRQGAYYFDDYNRKIYIQFIGAAGGRRTRTIVSPPVTVLNGVFTLSATGSVGTLQSNGYLTPSPIPNTLSTGFPGYLRVKARFSGGSPGVGTIVQDGPVWGIVSSVINGTDVYIDTLSGVGNWANGNATFYILPSGVVVPFHSIQILGWSLIVPTSQPITNINLTTTSGGAASAGTCNAALFQGFVSSGANSFPSESDPLGTPTPGGNSIGVAIGLDGWKASVKQINFATASSANNFELEFAKFGNGLAISTAWSINS